MAKISSFPMPFTALRFSKFTELDNIPNTKAWAAGEDFASRKSPPPQLLKLVKDCCVLCQVDWRQRDWTHCIFAQTGFMKIFSLLTFAPDQFMVLKSRRKKKGPQEKGGKDRKGVILTMGTLSCASYRLKEVTSHFAILLI
jgi:hypothetical protein